MWIGHVDVDVEQRQQRQKDGSAYLVILSLLLQLRRKADTVESDEDLFSAASAGSSSR